METRQVSTRIPLSEVPYLIRALGFYPTEQEVLGFMYSDWLVKDRRCIKTSVSITCDMSHSYLRTSGKSNDANDEFNARFNV